MTEQLEYGPFTDGYVAATDRLKIGPRAIGDASFDVGIDPTTGAVFRRGGSATAFDATNAGLLEAHWGARARQPFQLESDSLADGQPTLACLFTDYADKEARLWWRSTNAGGSQQGIGKSYGSTHRSNAASTVWNFRMLPLFTQHATQTFTRCVTELARRVIMAGSRSVLKTGYGVIAPCRDGTPVYWNGRFNDSSASGSEVEYVAPLGPLGPVLPIRRSGVPAAVANSAWKGSDACYFAVVYEKFDGSRSVPYVGGSPVTGGGTNGLIIVDAGGLANRYPYVTLIVPPGPPDTRARLICRTNKWDSSSAAAVMEDPTALLLCDVIRNNTQTLYNCYIGNDADLRERPDIIDFGRTMPPCGRHAFTMDGRLVFADLCANPCAVQLAPLKYDASYLDTYSADDVGAYGTNQNFFWFDGTNLKFKYGPAGGPATTHTTINTTGLTLRQLCDTINAMTVAAGNYPWRAQLAAGVDGDALCSDLQPTSGTDWFDDDTTCNDGTSGNQRVLNGHSIPGMLYFKATSAWMTKSVDRQAVHYTTANPSGTNTETEAVIAASNWRGGYDCRKRLDAKYGRIMGGGSLLDGALVGLTRGIGVIRNIRGGKTGADGDYRFEVWKGLSGCIAWGAQGDGWCVYLSRKGLMVNDGKREVCISPRVWNARGHRGAGRGPWAYAIGQAIKGVAKDDDSNYFRVSVIHGAILVHFKSAAGSTADRTMVYDFSASLNEVGVDQVLRPDGTPFAWSAPYRIKTAIATTVTKDDGEHVFGMCELNDGTTGDGRVDEIELASSQADNGATIVAQVALETSDFGDQRGKKRVFRVDLEYYSDVAEGSLTAYLDIARTIGAVIVNPIPAVGPTEGTISKRLRLRVPVALHRPCETFELLIQNGGSGASRYEIHRVTAHFKRLATHAATA